MGIDPPGLDPRPRPLLGLVMALGVVKVVIRQALDGGFVTALPHLSSCWKLECRSRLAPHLLLNSRRTKTSLRSDMRFLDH